MNKLFDPLHELEEPTTTLAGSGKGLSNPIAHIFKYMVISFQLPWPLGRWPVGLRHKLIPPADPDVENEDTNPKKLERMIREVKDGSKNSSFYRQQPFLARLS